MLKTSSLLSKAAKGIQLGDVSNTAVRNILTLLSVEIAGKVTQDDIREAEEFFDWKCPYTGKDLKDILCDTAQNHASVQLDHLVPINKEYCGLNIKGNLVWVDRAANSAKGSKSVDEFLLTDTKVLGDLDINERKARLDKIHAFQKKCGYDPKHIKDVISPLLKKFYEDIQIRQTSFAEELLSHLKDD